MAFQLQRRIQRMSSGFIRLYLWTIEMLNRSTLDTTHADQVTTVISTDILCQFNYYTVLILSYQLCSHCPSLIRFF